MKLHYLSRFSASGIRRINISYFRLAGLFFLLAGPFLSQPAFAGFDLLVSSMANNRVLRYNGRTGTFLSTLVPQGAGLAFPIGLAIKNDQSIYVCNSLTDSVRRYSAETGVSQGVFASGGGLDFPQHAVFGPDGNLYVGDANNAVLRYNGLSGAFMGAFTSGAPSAPNGLDGGFGLAFGPDGNLYVSSFGNNLILRYDGATGVFMDQFASGAGLASPYGLTFGADGHLYVVSSENASVLRFNGQTGAFMDVFIPSGAGGLSSPVGIAFGPDQHLYVSSFNTHSILKFDGTSGALIAPFVLPAAGGLTGPAYFAFRHVCSRGDLNSDDLVSLDDVPIFVDTLLGLDTDPVHLDEADLSCDGVVNGLDIAPFVAAILGA